MTAGLEVRDLTVRFGGLVAIDGLSFSAPVDRITGLIGPNGAGKSTAFNACSGLLSPAAGSVSFRGEDIGALSPDRRARLGMGRTFQHMELFDSQSVGRNVEMGAEARQAGQALHRQLFATGSERRAAAAAASEALTRCGIAHLAGHRVAGLSTGQRRLVELAHVLAGGFSFLLLDEVSSGLDRDETAAIGDVLVEVARAGVGILIVEHDMSLVMSVCHYLYVIDFGKLIFAGTPREVRESELVKQAYLGSSEVSV